MAYNIVALDLSTKVSWVEQQGLTQAGAREEIARLRKKRGHWREDPVVHAMVDPETKIEHKRASLLQWLKENVA